MSDKHSIFAEITHIMKKILFVAAVAVALTSCKKSEEVKVDETPMEKVADTIPQDTLASNVESPVTTETVAEQTTPSTSETAPAASYASFGAKIKADKALTKEEMLRKYKALKKGDTISVKFASTIKSVCKKKGCWMEMELPNNQISFVRFKDYGFFVPLNADKSDAIVSGRAFVDVVSVDERRHYAKDEGKSEEEIAKITEPKVTYAFQADGVLIKE